MVAVNVALSLTITAIVALVAVSVAVVPIAIMLGSEHRHLHGDARSWRRRHRGEPSSVLDLPRQYTQTTTEKQQELV